MSDDQGDKPASEVSDNKHVALAYRYVSDAWFPINPTLLTKIQDNLYAGSYDHNRESLLTDLKQDCALYLYCLRRLSEMTAGQSDNGSFAFSPQQLLKDSPLALFRAVLAVQAHGVSTHHEEETKPEHASCCERAVISATTAEALSESFELDEIDAYSCALLRQLGITLIAWNYPHVYSRVMATLPAGESPDELLGKMLGFSPQLLALTLARAWKLSPEILVAMGSESAAVESAEEAKRIGKIGAALSKVCAIGEAFASSLQESPETPQARHEEAMQEILSRLGPAGVSYIQKLVRSNLRLFARSHPVLSKWSEPEPLAESSESPPPKSPREDELHAKELMERNLYLKRCSAEERQEFELLYSSLDPSSISKNSLDILRSRIIPRFGFERGCIYLIDPDSMMLIPRLPLGSAALMDYQAVKFSTSDSAFDPIIAAFSSKNPSIEEKLDEHRNKVFYLAGSLGELQRAGVLYLELGQEQLESRRHTNPLIAFKAIRHALGDILALK
ncbi:MAG: HDOD domain-containing protein [Deltaproteobacteria bacterium]|nr:HDOD domain-containing protein [Deltaproteobacteria bacterium]